MKTLLHISSFTATGLVLLLTLKLVAPAQAATPDAAESGDLVPIQMTTFRNEPVIAGSGTYLLPGEKTGEKLGFVRHMVLAYVGRYPDILDHRAAAFDIARLLLTDQAQDEFIIRKSSPETSVWIGETEFAKERAYHSFVDKYRSVLVAAAPEPPLSFWWVERTRLGRYDFDRGGYNTYGPKIAKPFATYSGGRANARSITGTNYWSPGVSYINFNSAVEVPAFLPMSADRAEELTNFLVNQDEGNSVYFGAHVTVTRIVPFDSQQKRMVSRQVTGLMAGILIVEINSLGLFADADLTHLIHRYDVTTRDHQP